MAKCVLLGAVKPSIISKENAMFLLEGNLPRWYEIGLTENGLRIDAHPAVVPSLAEMTPDNPAVNDHVKALKVPPFVSPNQNVWGYGGNLHRITARYPDWLAWECVWPVVDFDNPVQAYALSASLQLLFIWLQQLEQVDSCKLQLITIDYLTVNKRIGGGSITARLAPALFPWLQSSSRRQVEHQSAEKMDAVYAKLSEVSVTSGWGNVHQDSKRWCRVDIRPPKDIHFNLGMATGLDPIDSDSDPEHPCRLDSHNSEHPIHQLTLLAGLAAIHDLARADGL